MKVTLDVGQDRKPIFPEELVESLHLEPGARVVVDFGSANDTSPGTYDREKFDAAVKKYSGSMRKEFLAEGWTSVEEYMNDMRSR